MMKHQSPHQLYTPSLREPLPLLRKPYSLPVPPEQPEKPQKMNWLRTLLPPLIMLGVLGFVASTMDKGGFLAYTMIMMVVYPFARGGAYLIEKRQYDKKEAERKVEYEKDLKIAKSEITTLISRQRQLLKREFLLTHDVVKVAQARGDIRRLWNRTDTAIDFLQLRIGRSDGVPTFPILVPKDADEVDLKDPLLKEAKKLKAEFQTLHRLPYLLDIKNIGSIAIKEKNNKLRYGLTYRLLLEILVHHRPDEVDVYVLSNHDSANKIWGWLRWLPHTKVMELVEKREREKGNEKDRDVKKELDHLVFGNQAIKMFLGRFENNIKKNKDNMHKVFIIDVNGIQQYDSELIKRLITNSTQWNLSLLFVGSEKNAVQKFPHSVRGVIDIVDNGKKAVFIDTKVDTKDIEEKEYHTLITLDEFPTPEDCKKIARSLAGIKLLGSSGGELLTPNISLFDVIDLGKDEKLTHGDVHRNWSYGVEGGLKNFKDEELLQFPIGKTEENAELVAYDLNLLEARFGGKDAYHTMVIGTTGSGKSEFIKSLILGAAYKYPPQYLNFFCMDFKGGSTIDQLEELPHVIGVMTNLDEVLAQRGYVAVDYEIDRRQAEFKKAKVKDIWEYNEGIDINKRMPHLVLVLDEFTRGLDMLDDPQFNLQDLLEKRLVPQGRSLGIYLILANQVANSKATKLLPNVGWRIALKVASREQMSFIDSSLKRPEYAGRGYIQAMGEDSIEFQSGYSGNPVKYDNIKIKQSDISLKEVLPNGHTLTLKEAKKITNEDAKKNDYLEMNQLIKAIQITQSQLKIPRSKKIYLPPMPRQIDMSYTIFNFKEEGYRNFSRNKWSRIKNKESFLKIPAGIVDLTEQCSQETLRIDFKKKTPHLLFVGSQSDLNDGLRSVLFPLLSTHSPDDLHIYMLEFGQGLRDIVPYPHIGDIILEKEIEKITRVIDLIENEFEKRENASLDENNPSEKRPELFLIINNLAGLKNDVSLYTRIIQLISKESHKYGIHIIAMVLPRGTGSRIAAGDLKLFKSRIVFPSVNPENYWMYLELAERKLARLTSMDIQPDDDSRFVSRAYWLCQNDPDFGKKPLEIQLALPNYGKKIDEKLVSSAVSEAKYNTPVKIDILKDQYILPARLLKSKMQIGIKWLDIDELSVHFDELPPIWGVSGPRKSGKTNFLTSFLYQASRRAKDYEVDVFSLSPSSLTDYSNSKKYNVVFELEDMVEKFNEILNEDFENRKKHRLLVFDDINLLWERKNDEVIKVLATLAHKMHRKENISFIASFNYSRPMKTAVSQDSFLREFVNNKTGLLLGYDGEWLIDSMTLSKYKKKFEGAIPSGRGVFVQNGDEIEVQAYFYEGKE